MSVEEEKELVGRLTTDSPFILQPSIKDSGARARMLKEIVNSMRSNAIPANAPHLTREELHARR
jgi:hypothetical protein